MPGIDNKIPCLFQAAETQYCVHLWFYLNTNISAISQPSPLLYTDNVGGATDQRSLVPQLISF